MKAYRSVFSVLISLLSVLGASFLRGQEQKNYQVMKGIGQFYRTPTGTVSFLPYASTLEDAKEATEFYMLQENGAYKLRKQAAYWLIVNHRTDTASEVTYLGVEIIPIYPNSVEPKAPILLRRNSGWIRKDDPSFEGNNEVQKTFEGKEIIDFLNFHEMDSRLSDLDKEFGFKWHAELKESREASWEKRIRWKPGHPLGSDDFRKNFVPPVPSDSKMMLNGMLIRFSTTNRISSEAPLLFGFNGTDPIAAYICIFAPDKPDFDHEYYLTFE